MIIQKIFMVDFVCYFFLLVEFFFCFIFLFIELMCCECFLLIKKMCMYVSDIDKQGSILNIFSFIVICIFFVFCFLVFVIGRNFNMKGIRNIRIGSSQVDINNFMVNFVGKSIVYFKGNIMVRYLFRVKKQRLVIDMQRNKL